jgi:hypothetical protein
VLQHPVGAGRTANIAQTNQQNTYRFFATHKLNSTRKAPTAPQ